MAEIASSTGHSNNQQVGSSGGVKELVLHHVEGNLGPPSTLKCKFNWFYDFVRKTGHGQLQSIEGAEISPPLPLALQAHHTGEGGALIFIGGNSKQRVEFSHFKLHLNAVTFILDGGDAAAGTIYGSPELNLTYSTNYRK